jgi:AcrR family transcriptional regulator
VSTFKLMKDDSSYHHGDLHAALVNAAAVEIERGGYESLSLRELAESVGVSRTAPYRHFADRRALLAAVALDGFERLTAIYRRAMGSGNNPRDRLAAAGRGYLRFAAERPQMFRLMFVSDLLGGGTVPPNAALIDAAGECYFVFEKNCRGDDRQSGRPNHQSCGNQNHVNRFRVCAAANEPPAQAVHVRPADAERTR